MLSTHVPAAAARDALRLASQRLGLCLMISLLLCANATAGGVAVQNLDGTPGSMSEYLSQDKYTLVMVWTTYCHVCRTQYPTISTFHSKHADKDAIVLGISLDGFDKAAKVVGYRSTQGHTFPSVLSDADEFKTKYELTTGADFTGTPTYLLFDPKQQLVGYIDGPVKLESLEKAILN